MFNKWQREGERKQHEDYLLMVFMYSGTNQIGLALSLTQYVQMLAKEWVQWVSCVFLAFMYLTLIVKRRIKLRPDRQAKLDALLQRKGKSVQIFAIAGTVISGTVVMIAVVDYWMHRG